MGAAGDAGEEFGFGEWSTSGEWGGARAGAGGEDKGFPEGCAGGAFGDGEEELEDVIGSCRIGMDGGGGGEEGGLEFARRSGFAEFFGEDFKIFGILREEGGEGGDGIGFSAEVIFGGRQDQGGVFGGDGDISGVGEEGFEIGDQGVAAAGGFVSPGEEEGGILRTPGGGEECEGLMAGGGFVAEVGERIDQARDDEGVLRLIGGGGLIKRAGGTVIAGAGKIFGGFELGGPLHGDEVAELRVIAVTGNREGDEVEVKLKFTCGGEVISGLLKRDGEIKRGERRFGRGDLHFGGFPGLIEIIGGVLVVAAFEPVAAKEIIHFDIVRAQGVGTLKVQRPPGKL